MKVWSYWDHWLGPWPVEPHGTPSFGWPMAQGPLLIV